MSDEVEAEMMHNPGINPGDFLGSAWRRSIPYVARGCNILASDVTRIKVFQKYIPLYFRYSDDIIFLVSIIYKSYTENYWTRLFLVELPNSSIYRGVQRLFC